MILSETKARPIVDLLIKNAVDTIKEETGVEIPYKEIEEQLVDIEWIIVAGYTESEEYMLHINTIVDMLDRIMDRIEQSIFDEREDEKNVDF